MNSPSHPISLRYTSMLSSHLRLRLPECLFPPRFPTKSFYKFLFSPKCTTHPAKKIYSAHKYPASGTALPLPQSEFIFMARPLAMSRYFVTQWGDLQFAFFTKNYYGNQILKAEMGSVSWMHARHEKCIQIFGRKKLERRDHFEEKGIDRRIC
jgi:hypothetical protein